MVTKKELSDFIQKSRNLRNVCLLSSLEFQQDDLINYLRMHSGFYLMDPPVDPNNLIDDCSGNVQVEAVVWPLIFQLKGKYLDKMSDEDQFEVRNNERVDKFLVNLINTPNHIEMMGEVANHLSIVDGAILVIDCLMVLFIDNVNQLLFYRKLKEEDIYQILLEIIVEVNEIIKKEGGDNIIDTWNVIFGSAKNGWSFTLSQFVELYEEKFGIGIEELTKKLWGDQYFNPKSKKWIDKPINEKSQRSFCQLILDPILNLTDSIMNKTKEEIDVFTKEKMKIQLTPKELQLEGKKLSKTILGKWLPLIDCFSQIICTQLPSPVKAQKYRTSIIYSKIDETSKSIENFNPNGSLMVKVVRLLPITRGRCYAIGRIFCGRVKKGQKVWIHEGKGKTTYKKVESVIFINGNNTNEIDIAEVGSIIGLSGLDTAVTSGCTITNCENSKSFSPINYTTKPIIGAQIKVKYEGDLIESINCIKRISKFDPTIDYKFNKKLKEHYFFGIGEYQLGKQLQKLDERVLMEIVKLDFFICYRETIKESSSPIKSQYKNYKIKTSVNLMPKELIENVSGTKIEATKVNIGRIMKEKYGVNEILSIDKDGLNLLVDVSGRNLSLSEYKSSLIQAFKTIIKEGPVCGEEIHGVCFNIHEVAVLTKELQFNVDHLIEGVHKSLSASLLSATPCFLEPFCLAEIHLPQNTFNQVVEVVNKFNGIILNEKTNERVQLIVLKVCLPIKNVFELSNVLKAEDDQVKCQSIFDYWKLVDGDLNDEKSKVGRLFKEIRGRKGMSLEIPKVDDFVGKS